MQMPMQKSKSSFDINKSLQTHSTDDTDYGQDFTRLPGGISGGIAQLIDAKIGVYKTGANTGKKFFRAAGVVVSPDTATEMVKTLDERGKVKVVSAKEVPVKGLQTSVMVPLCDTKKADGTVTTADEGVANMLNELRKL